MTAETKSASANPGRLFLFTGISLFAGGLLSGKPVVIVGAALVALGFVLLARAIRKTS